MWSRFELLLRRAGAVACGYAAALPVDAEVTAQYREWLGCGFNAGMNYMERYPEIREDPRLMLDGARTIVSAAFSFAPSVWREEPGMVACYAYGDDYHDVLRRRLSVACGAMKEEYGGEYRICIDSAPVHERYWAVKTGVGARLDNGMVAVPGHGCEVFLAEIITTLEFAGGETGPTPGLPPQEACLHCGACRRACPAGALGEAGMIDSRRCLSYLTIEHRGEWTDPVQLEALATPAGRAALFGCDLCLRVCPLNAGAPPTGIGEFAPRSGILGLSHREIAGMTQTEFSARFRGSPVKRARLDGLKRNAAKMRADI